MAEEVINDSHTRLTEIGETIRARRETLGLSIEEVQEKTKIRSKYLMAVEAGDDNIAPGKAYFRAFLKSYAEFLGLDGLEFSRIYREIAEGEVTHRTQASTVPKTHSTGTSVRTGKRRRKKGRTGIATVVIMLVLIAAVLWGAAKIYNHVFRPAKPSQSAELQNNNGNGQPNTQPEQLEGEPQEEPNGVVIKRSDPSEQTTVFETNQAPLQVTLTTLPGEDTTCWIQAKTDGQIAIEKTMGSDESVDITAQSEIHVRAGKPWVLTMTLNGQDLGKGGPYGPVKDLIFRYNEEI